MAPTSNALNGKVTASKPFRVSVLGAGAWGCALAQHLAVKGEEVRLWGRSLAELHNTHRTHYLPGIIIDERVLLTERLEDALADVEVIVMAIPSSALNEVLLTIEPLIDVDEVILVNTAKGLEPGTCSRMSEVVVRALATDKVVTLSGPSFAQEVARGEPTAVVVASNQQKVAEAIQTIFHSGSLRVYTSNDLIGVELGGVLKNVMALAVGMAEGLGFGLNARAAIITRGLREMTRLICALGGQADTVAGLSGLGDLVLTATGNLSRNRRLGILLGQGEPLASALQQVTTAEAVISAPIVKKLAQLHQIEMPITDEVSAVLNGEVSVSKAAPRLMERSMKREYV